MLSSEFRPACLVEHVTQGDKTALKAWGSLMMLRSKKLASPATCVVG